MSVPKRTADETASQNAAYAKIMDERRRSGDATSTLLAYGDSYRPRDRSESSSVGRKRSKRSGVLEKDSATSVLQAFEEEETLRQRRHEAELARKAEIMAMELEHERQKLRLRREFGALYP